MAYANNGQTLGGIKMIIAVTYENGQIFQHFGHTAQFKLFTVEGQQVVSSRVVDTNGSGHGALARFLQANQVDVLICGGIGQGAKAALSEAGIQLYGGASGSADMAVESLLKDTLVYNPNVRCNHHDEAHGEGHSCQDHENHDCGHHCH